MEGSADGKKNQIQMAKKITCTYNGILLPKLLWPTVRKKNSSDQEKPL